MSSVIDFEIKNGVLIKYRGSDADVVVPDGVTCIADHAFYNCWSLTSVTLPSGVTSIGNMAFWSCRNLTSVLLPKGLATIGNSAFSGCRSLCNIILPESVTIIGYESFYRCENLISMILPMGIKHIGDRAFCGCKKLADENGFVIVGDILFDFFGKNGDVVIPKGVLRIGHSAFQKCDSLINVILPDGLTNIGFSAFSGCTGLTRVTLPEGLTDIGDSAFSNCSSLKSIALPEGLTRIGELAFFGCENLRQISIPESVNHIGPRVFDGCSSQLFIRLSEKSMNHRKGRLAEGGNFLLQIRKESEAFLFAYGSNNSGDMLDLYYKEDFWEKYDRAFSREEFRFCISVKLLGAAGRLLYPEGLNDANRSFYRKRLCENPVKTAAAAEKYGLPEVVRMLFAEGLVDEESAQKIGKQLKKTKVPAFSSLAGLEFAANADAKWELIPAEALLDELLMEEDRTQAQLGRQFKQTFSLVLPDLPVLKDVQGHTLSYSVLAFLFLEDQRAGHLLPFVDSVSFQAALRTLSDEYLIKYQTGKKLNLIGPVCRYADEDLMRDLCARAPKWATSVSGKNAPMLREFRNAVLYSDTLAAMQFADKNHMLEQYAALRGTDADALRDKTVSDVGLDENRGKTYDLGNQVVTARLQKDLSFLFELPNGKTAKSLPKKGADEGKYATAKADFDEMRKSVKKILKNRFDRLFEDFLNGRTRDAAGWKDAYLKNPLLRDAASRLIWAQGSATFTLTDTDAVDSAGKPYSITDAPIKVAHPMEMKTEETKAWQKYITKHGIRQPFLQVWEPVRQANQIHTDRYAGIELDIMTFSGKEKHGIHAFGLHAYSEEFGFSLDDCTLSYDCSTWRLGFYVNDGYTYKLGDFRFPRFTRKVNHIVTILDGLTVEDRITKDDVTVAEAFPGYTLAQITEFISAAQEAKATNVLALLLDYKEKNFPDFDPMDEFTLEW